MTTVWVLSDGPDEHEQTVLGVFSSYDRMKSIKDAFALYGGGRGEMIYEEYQVDKLEELGPVLLVEMSNGYRIYSMSRHISGLFDSKGKWWVYQMSPMDIGKYTEDTVNSYLEVQYATIRARSEQEAIEIAEKMLKEKTS